MQKDNKAWYKGNTLVLGAEEDNKKALLEVYHNAPTAGHLGVFKTFQALAKDY